VIIYCCPASYILIFMDASTGIHPSTDTGC
jgi:hypothetical protein